MDKKRKSLFMLMAAAAMSVVLSGCENFNYEEEQVNRLDEEITCGEKVTTPRNLFSASEETINYAGLIEATGEYRYDYSHRYGSLSDGGVEEENKAKIVYTGVRDNEGNASSNLTCYPNWKSEYKMSSIFLSGMDGNTCRESSGKCNYYKQNVGDESDSRFIYYGDGSICDRIEIDKILVPDNSQLCVEEFSCYNDTINVRIGGDMQQFIEAFGENIEGTHLISQAVYRFDANTYKLKNIELHGEIINDKSQKESWVNGKKEVYEFPDVESKSFTLTLNIDNVDKTPSEMIELPEVCCQNGYINDLILNDAEFDYTDEINCPFENMKSEGPEIAKSIWSEFTSGNEIGSCTIKEMETSLKEIASNHGCDDVRSSYAFVKYEIRNDVYDYGVLIKNEFMSGEDVKCVVMLPIVIDQNPEVLKSCIVLDGSDYAKFGCSGIMEFARGSSSCQCSSRYGINRDGTVTLLYEETKTSNISTLSDEANLAFYPENDRGALKSMATGLDIASISGIARLHIRESEKDSSGDAAYLYHDYYVIDYDLGENRIDEIDEAYSVKIISEASKNRKIDDIKGKKEITEVEWTEVEWTEASEEE